MRPLRIPAPSAAGAAYAPERALAPFLAARTPVVLGQLGQTLDGRIATVTGASRTISGAGALTHLHRLRAAADAVLVGVGTAVADDPRLTARLAPGPNPRRVVIDPEGRLPAGARMLADGAGPVLVLCGPEARPPPGAEALRLPLGPEGFAPEAVVAALAARGLGRILLEGGAATLGRFLDAGRVDLLHLLVAPIILGSGKPGLELRPVERLDQALRPATEVHLFEDGDVLFTCQLRRSAP